MEDRSRAPVGRSFMRRPKRASIEEIPVQTAVLDGFEEVGRGDGAGSGEIGDSTRDLENAIVGAGREVQLFHGLLQQDSKRGIDGTMLADLRMGHAGVDGGAGAGEARLLAPAGGLDPGADGRRWLAGLGLAQLFDRQGRCLDMEVNAVKQRPADARAVALDLRWRAPALMPRIAEVTAGAGIGLFTDTAVLAAKIVERSTDAPSQRPAQGALGWLPPAAFAQRATRSLPEIIPPPQKLARGPVQ